MIANLFFWMAMIVAHEHTPSPRSENHLEDLVREF